MGTPLVDRIPFARIVTVMAIVFCIALGLCGVDVMFDQNSYRSGLSNFLFLLVAFDAIGLIVTIAVWIVLAIVKGIFD